MAIEKVKKEKKSLIRKSTPPTLINIKYDMEKNIKYLTYKITHHHYDEDKYINTTVTEKTEQFFISDHDRQNIKKNNLMIEINEDVSKINLNKIKSVSDIIKFSSDGSSKREMMRRAVKLCERILKEKNIRYKVSTQMFRNVD